MHYSPRHAIARLSTATKAVIVMAATGGLLGAGAVAAISASASTAPSCGSGVSASGPFSENVTDSASVPYYVGARNLFSAGSPAILRASRNELSEFFHCDQGSAVSFLIRTANGTVYALTSRDSLAGGNVTLERPGNGHLGYASQKWDWVQNSDGSYTFQNVKTGLYLRVRNSGPAYGQTVTTGKMATDWTQQ